MNIMLILNSDVKYDGRMDKDVIELCDAINALPALHTIESCSGHGKQPFQIWFRCDGTTMQGLFFLTRCIDRRYFQHGWDWGISLRVADVFENGILPTNFLLESRNAWSDKKVKGGEAYKQAKDLVDNMNYHINHENLIQGYNLNINEFRTAIVIISDCPLKNYGVSEL